MSDVKYKLYPVLPIAKPRMTRRDKWKNRPCVVRYNAFKDAVRENNIYVPECGATVTFFIPMPDSWTKKRKKEMVGMPHRGAYDKSMKMDIDNLLKALLDAIYKDDSCIYDIRAQKFWSVEGAISVKINEPDLEEVK